MKIYWTAAHDASSYAVGVANDEIATFKNKEDALHFAKYANAYQRLVDALLEFTTAAEAGILWDSAADRDFVDSRQSQQAINLLRELGELK